VRFGPCAARSLRSLLLLGSLRCRVNDHLTGSVGRLISHENAAHAGRARRLWQFGLQTGLRPGSPDCAAVPAAVIDIPVTGYNRRSRLTPATDAAGLFNECAWRRT